MNEMAAQIATYLEHGAGFISLFAVLIVVVGFVLASVRYAQGFRTASLVQRFSQFTTRSGLTMTEMTPDPA